jgi:ABC-2 type transport system ATP-binding protein
LADRVGIIDHAVLVAEGTPSALKRSIGSDLVVIRTEGSNAQAEAALRTVTGVDRVDIRGDEIVVSVTDGSAAISPVAVALSEANVTVRELTLRTPTLDDVFLTITGAHLAGESA